MDYQKSTKPNVPLRPIVALKGSPTYNLAKWMSRKFNFLREGSVTFVNSASQFLAGIRGKTIRPDQIMVSFDVVSLFTSIPQDLARDVLRKRLEDKYDETTGLLKTQHLMQLCAFCQRTFFTFGGRTYEQIKETPMGSSISSLVAGLVLQELGKVAFSHYKPAFWRRYVDDTFAIIEKDRLSGFQDLLNSICPDIQFTREDEEDEKLPFLYVPVTRTPDRSANELHGDININIAAPSFSPVHFDEAKGPANDAQTAENRGMLNRDHCIIIQGLPESSASTPRERVATDLEQFQKLLNEMLQPTENVTVLRAFRLGSRTTAAPQTRPRPPKIVLEKTAQLTCSTEALWLTIRAPGSQSLDILTVYRPLRNDPVADAQLLEELRLFSTRPTTLIAGDFNAPHINWSSASADCSETAFDQQLLRTSDNLLLTQHIMFPTRVREGQQMNCLDLMFTKSSDNIDVVNCLPPLGQSDHVVLMWEYTLFSLPAQPLDSRTNIWRGDFEQMRKDLSPID
ncbi:hypothetical protein SprV_0200702500 [Sparganum proliferum]